MATTTTRQQEKQVPVQSLRSTTTTTFVPNDDVSIEILSRVPAKSLMQMRWACKYWFDLITRDHDDFIKLHLRYHCSSTSTVSVLVHGTKLGELRQCYFNRNCLSTRVRLSHPFQFGSGFVCLASCNGLLFGRSDDYTKYCILNPCTQEYRLLPNPPLEQLPSWDIHAFVYDHMIDEYKVLCTGYPHLVIHVYTLRTNSWTSIKRRSEQMYSDSPVGKYANGCLYWIDSSSVTKIICFDLGKEKYHEESIEQFLHDKIYLIGLQVLEGSLCLVQYIKVHLVQYNMGHEYTYNDHSVQIWVMKDNGITNESSTRTSWTQLFTTPISLGRYDQSIKPLIKFSRTGEILLLKNEQELVLYDPKSNTTITFDDFRREKEIYIGYFEVYVESLVSLNSGTYVEQKKQRWKRKRNLIKYRNHFN